MRFSNIVLIYFVVGAVMFGGGAVDFQESGVTQFFVDQDSGGDLNPSEEPQSLLDSIAGTITSLVGEFGAPVILVWNLSVGLIGFSAWPFVTLTSNNAPMSVSLLLGGSLTAAFYLSLIVLVKSSA